MKKSIVALLPVLFPLSVSVLCGQLDSKVKTTDNPPPVLTATDQKWANLQALLAPPSTGELASLTDPASRATARKQQAGRFLMAADQARAFAESNPSHPKSAEARRLEAKGILQAAMAGDVSREARVSALIDEVRRESNLPAKSRLEVVALADVVRLRPLAGNRVRFLAEHEKSARSLIAEFPGEAGAYDGLLRLAESHPDDAEAIRIARDIREMPAPENVKAAAGVLLDRHALVGQSLTQLAEESLGKTNLISATKGQGTILYAWASWSPGSVAAARNLAKIAPAGVHLVGVNLDQDTTKARTLATSEKLPGEQLYDERGVGGPLAQALKLTRVGEVYVASADGKLRSVSAQRGDLTAKLGNAAR